MGELVADAVASGTFLVVTAPEIHDELLLHDASPTVPVQLFEPGKEEAEDG